MARKDVHPHADPAARVGQTDCQRAESGACAHARELPDGWDMPHSPFRLSQVPQLVLVLFLSCFTSRRQFYFLSEVEV